MNQKKKKKNQWSRVSLAEDWGGICRELSDAFLFYRKNKSILEWFSKLFQLFLMILGAPFGIPFSSFFFINVVVHENVDWHWFFIGIMIDFLFYGIRKFENIISNNSSITRYVKDLDKANIKLYKFEIEDYLTDANIIKTLRYSRHDLYINKESLGHIFYLEAPDTLLTIELKGFSLIDDSKFHTVSISCIFVDVLPQDLTLVKKFQVLHEIGHMTEKAFDLRMRRFTFWNQLVFSLFLFITVLNCFEVFPWMLLFLLPLLLVKFLRARESLFFEESYCDDFAMKNLGTLKDRLDLFELFEKISFFKRDRLNSLKDNIETPAIRDWEYYKNIIQVLGYKARAFSSVMFLIPVFYFTPIENWWLKWFPLIFLFAVWIMLYMILLDRTEKVRLWINKQTD